MLASFLGVLPILTPPLCALAFIMVEHFSNKDKALSSNPRTTKTCNNSSLMNFLNNRNLFLTVLESEKSKIKVSQGRFYSEASSLGLWVLPSYCVNMTFSHTVCALWHMYAHPQRRRRGERE
jgi:hypothetical protein